MFFTAKHRDDKDRKDKVKEPKIKDEKVDPVVKEECEIKLERVSQDSYKSSYNSQSYKEVYNWSELEGGNVYIRFFNVKFSMFRKMLLMMPTRAARNKDCT